jgi:hypothetical protein
MELLAASLQQQPAAPPPSAGDGRGPGAWAGPLRHGIGGGWGLPNAAAAAAAGGLPPPPPAPAAAAAPVRQAPQPMVSAAERQRRLKREPQVRRQLAGVRLCPRPLADANVWYQVAKVRATGCEFESGTRKLSGILFLRAGRAA